jgi:hypothetical protein
VVAQLVSDLADIHGQKNGSHPFVITADIGNSPSTAATGRYLPFHA